MRPTSVSLTAAGEAAVSAPIRVNWRQSPFNANITVTTDGNTTGFTVQWTLDPPSDFDDATDWNTNGNWFDHSVLAGLTQDAYGGLDYPVQGVRLACNDQGTDTGTLLFTQGQNG